jgi:hypothetical protein
MADECIRICGTLMYHRRFESLPASLPLMDLLRRTKGARWNGAGWGVPSLREWS